ncbi:MAG: hypothetical protein K6L76_01690 [Agarilytica sp.]
MYEAHQLEEMVIAIRDQSTRTSVCVMDEYFAENIDQKMQKLPSDCRDEFMRIAIEHGYQSASERRLNFAPEADGFDGDFYDDLFGIDSTDELH